jgi:hypothetical protein
VDDTLAEQMVLALHHWQAAAREGAMNYCSSVAERAIEAVNRLLIATMTSVWTSTLIHQHLLPPPEEDGSDGEICPQQDSSSKSDWLGGHR